ncbi:MAG: PAS domain S-box protein [Candidatus Cloacimonetes bacterium]|nr:PAS domain S-box protein [Candidatus Cloacimonadota bacterium]
MNDKELICRNQANFLDSVIENSPFAMWVSDAKGILIRANQSLRDVLNVTDDMIIGKYNVLHDENLPSQGFMPVVEAVFNDLKSARFTMFWTGAKAGDVDLSSANALWIDVSMFPIIDEAGKLMNVVCQYVDITERKKAEEALRESEEKYRTLIDNVNIGVYRNTPGLQGKFIEVNPAIIKMFGYQNRREFLGINVTDLYQNPEDRKKFNDRMLNEGFVKDERLLLKKKDGTFFFGSLSTVAITDGTGEVIYYDGVITNINERIKAEEEITKKSIELETQFEESEKQRIATLSVLSDLNETTRNLKAEISVRKQAEVQIKKDLEVKTILLREVHHRVNNNMQIISSLLNMQSNYIKDDEDKMLLKESRNRVQTMALIHEKLYNSEDFSSIDFNSFIRSSVMYLMSFYSVDSRQIKFRFETGDIFVDLNLAIPCGLIINELVSNALKYAFPENRKGEVLISTKFIGDNYTFIISDNGIGLPEETDLKNHDKFGLHLVDILIRQIKGKVEIDRQNGTKFTICFGKTKINTYRNV